MRPPAGASTLRNEVRNHVRSAVRAGQMRVRLVSTFPDETFGRGIDRERLTDDRRRLSEVDLVRREMLLHPSHRVLERPVARKALAQSVGARSAPGSMRDV